MNYVFISQGMEMEIAWRKNRVFVRTLLFFITGLTVEKYLC